jgi:hypothetical protein
MKNILLYAILCVLLMNCKKDVEKDPASRIEGQYRITWYIIDKDTLISPEKGNLSQFSHFEAKVTRKGEQTIDIFLETDALGGGQGIPDVQMERDNENNRYSLIMLDNTIDTDYGHADEKSIRLRMAGWNHLTDKTFYNIIEGIKYDKDK